MVRKARFRYIVEVDKDTIPGWNHEPGDMKEHLEDTLPEWYNPTVKYIGITEVNQ